MADDQLREPAALLTALIERVGLGQILPSEIPSADRIDLLCAFIEWKAFGS